MINIFLNKVFYKLGYNLVKLKNNNTKRNNELILYKTKTGNYYLPKNCDGDVVAQSIINNHVFDFEIVDLAKQYIKPNTTVIDAGSNFGQMAVLYSNMVGDNGKVLAFDADDFVFSILEKNIEANGKKNIKAFFGALHNEVGKSLFFPVQDFVRFQSYGSYGIDYKDHKGREVKTLTIDSLNITEPISFMKIDVQGGDLFVLQGAKETILKNKMPILFEYEYLFEEEQNFNFQQYIDFINNELNYKFERVINGQNYLIIPK